MWFVRHVNIIQHLRYSDYHYHLDCVVFGRSGTISAVAFSTDGGVEHPYLRLCHSSPSDATSSMLFFTKKIVYLIKSITHVYQVRR